MRVTKKATEVDLLAGRRLRAFRVGRGLSQTDVGNHLGITFQQVQKYERGANRMGASRLQALAELLGVEVSEFFEPGKGDKDGPEFLIGTLQERRLLTAFRELNSNARHALVEFIESL